MVPENIAGFLQAETPQEWLETATEQVELLVLDHANCEMKAASTAISMIHRYPQHADLVKRMSRLAREELRHFEQVQKHIDDSGIARRRVGPSRYAGRLLRHSSETEPLRLRHRLIVAALIEARSCERFALVADRVPAALGAFYRGLLESEARHFEIYLELARKCDADAAAVEFDSDVRRLCGVEAELITSADSQFRFHSGRPS